MAARKKLDTTNPEWLDTFFGPVYLDFVAPFPLETSLKLLKREEETGFFRYRKTRVDLIPENADTFGFYVKRWGGRSATIEARGFMKRWEADSTLVNAKVNLALWNYALYFLVIGIMLVVILPMFARMTWFSLLFVGIMIANWVYMRYQRHTVAHLIEKALLADLGGDIPPIESNW